MNLIYFGFAVVIFVLAASIGITFIQEIWRERKLGNQWVKDIAEGTADSSFDKWKQRGKRRNFSKNKKNGETLTRD